MSRSLKSKIMYGGSCFLTMLSPKLNTKVRYRLLYKRKLNLENPKYFNEKGMWLKLNRYNHDPLVKQCADKYAVRAYIEKTGCPEILNELIAVYDNVDQIDWDALPDAFVLKWNFGCGFNIVCADKNKLDIEKTKAQLKKWGKTKYYLRYSEMQYKNVPQKIICEKYLKPKSGVLPEDYKFFCFDGRAEYVMVCVGRETGNTAFYFFDQNWELARFNERGRKAPEGFTIPKPEGMDEMFAYAEKLSKGFPFVRVDLFNVDGKTVFGEMTFTPAAFLDDKYGEESELILGEKITLR